MLNEKMIELLNTNGFKVRPFLIESVQKDSGLSDLYIVSYNDVDISYIRNYEEDQVVLLGYYKYPNAYPSLTQYGTPEKAIEVLHSVVLINFKVSLEQVGEAIEAS